MGTLDQIKEEFGEDLDGSIERIPITEDDLKIVDGAVQCLVLEALVTSIASLRGLSTNGKDRLWEQTSFEQVTAGNAVYAIHRSAIADVRQIGGRLHLCIDPTFFVPSIDEVGDIEIHRKI